jgi:hypothetical protein
MTPPTSPLVPAERPQATRSFVEALCAAAKLDPYRNTVVVGRRGYYRDTMGVPGVNDTGVYDDALWLIGPGIFGAFNANTDPSRGRAGMATLALGTWTYRVGIHNQSKDPTLHPRYTALVQAAPVLVHRQGGKDQAGFFGINIHKGSLTSTSSEGCQTLYPDQWAEFIALAQKGVAKNPRAEIAYLLTEHG